jgi:ArsR family transcriptional regulator, arsenate/arsenite/antimonite-responsive transcriptional repressor
MDGNERRAVLPNSQEEIYTAIFNALRDPCRLDMIRMIGGRSELPCTTLDETMPISKSTISYHIKVLYRAGLISVRKEGRNYHYRLRNDVFDEFLPRFLNRMYEKREPGRRLKGPIRVAAAAGSHH